MNRVCFFFCAAETYSVLSYNQIQYTRIKHSQCALYICATFDERLIDQFISYWLFSPYSQTKHFI